MLLVLRRGGLGDTLLMLPVLRALRRVHPGAPLCFAGVAEFATVLARFGAVDRAVSSEDLQLWVGEPAGLSPGARALWTAATHVVADDPAARRLAPHAAVRVVDPRPARDDEPIARQWLRSLDLPAADDVAADACLVAVRAAFDVRAVALAPGSGGAGTCWPRADWLALARSLAAEGRSVAVVVGPAEQERDDPRRWSWPPGVRFLSDLTPVQLAERLATHGAFVGNDAGTTHLAAALRVPTVAIFGPSNARVFAPQGDHVRVVGSRTDGPPQVPVAEVLAALERLPAAGG